jgi:hypothetical protein
MSARRPGFDAPSRRSRRGRGSRREAATSATVERDEVEVELHLG